ncbi:hypothetical protein Zm00014a_027008 [Zea mays]|uniref:Uncharacterized protein n=1 Tax=Zea mays TaxID=4577 RepID=A0A3L6DY33_MAIZE|nr:hypothetical protein Zm00014a_027008 [Zea mays]
MITTPLLYAHAACHPPMGHLIRQEKQNRPSGANLHLARR